MDLLTPQLLVDKILPDWHYDQLRDLYITLGGKFLTPVEVRAMVELVVDGAKKEAKQLTTDLGARRIDVDKWLIGMTILIAALHTAASTVATGDAQGVLEQAQANLRATIATEKTYLNNFATDLRNILLGLAGATLMAGVREKGEMEQLLPMWMLRSMAYMDAGVVTYEEHRYYLMRYLGYTEARRVVDMNAEHCNGCIAQEERGWLPINEVPPLGSEECGQWCRCKIEYMKIRGDLQ